MNRKANVLICCCGSVAAVKVPEIAFEISKFAEVKIVSTESGLFFLKRSEEYNKDTWRSFCSIGGLDLVILDDYEWKSWNIIGDPVQHIELRRWADVMIVVPISANTLAKAAAGISDNMVLCIMRAWNFDKPCILCPAMNTGMYEHPATRDCLEKLRKWGYKVVDPVVKLLACKDVGNGALAPVSALVDAVKSAVAQAEVPSTTLSETKSARNSKYDCTFSTMSKIGSFVDSFYLLSSRVFRYCFQDNHIVFPCSILCLWLYWRIKNTTSTP
jgi:phosphopantothenoylcysteine decarboxylase